MIPPKGLAFDGVVVKVHDGDTVTIKTEVVFNLRLKMADGTGCYAPEVTGGEKPLGISSKEHLSFIALGKPVRVFIPANGLKTIGDVTSLQRVLGDAWVIDGPKESLAEIQLQKGFATTTKQPQKPKRFPF